jgi:multidrug efflux system membrane fusion protein
MKRSYLVAGAIAVVVCGWLLTGLIGDDGTPQAPKEADRSAELAVPAVQVRTIVAEPRVRQLSLFGRTEADRRVEVRAETGGRVADKVVEKGQKVNAGEVIVRLNMDDRRARLKRAEAEVEHRRVTYRASQSLAKSGFVADIKKAEDWAALEQARAALAAIKLDIERTEVRAPFDGIVDALPVEVGDYVQSGGSMNSSIVAEVVDLDPIVVVCDVPEKEVGRIRVGDEADVRLVTGERARGTVRYVARTANSATRTFRVEIEVANPEATIGEGITAEVRLRQGEILAHRVTPAILTLDDDGVVGVKVVEDGDRVVFHRVVIVGDTPEGVWLAGLPERVTLITVGQEFVRDGQRVRPVAEIAPAAATEAPAGRS